MKNTAVGLAMVIGITFLTFDAAGAAEPGARYGVDGDASGQGRVVAARPVRGEPATWSMMLVGFGMTGLAMRRSARRRPISALLRDRR